MPHEQSSSIPIGNLFMLHDSVVIRKIFPRYALYTSSEPLLLQAVSWTSASMEASWQVDNTTRASFRHRICARSLTHRIEVEEHIPVGTLCINQLRDQKRELCCGLVMRYVNRQIS